MRGCRSRPNTSRPAAGRSLVGCLAILLYLCPAAGAQEASTAESPISEETPARLAAPAAEGAPPGEPALAGVAVDGRDAGEAEFYLDALGVPLLPSKLLRDLLGGYVRSELLDLIAGRDRLVRPDELALLGVDLDYDPSELRLSFAVSGRARRPSSLALGRERNRGAQTDSGEAFALSLPLRLELSASLPLDASESPFGRIEAGLDPSLRAFGLVLEGGFDLGFQESAYARLRAARLVLDLPSLGARSSAGYLSPRLAGFQRSSSLLGLAFGRERSLPGGTPEPEPLEELFLERPAMVDIRVNGITARRLRLESGAYALSELPLASGLNRLEFHIEEEGRSPRIVAKGRAFDGSILPRGDLDYQLAAGLDRQSLSRPLATGFLALGLGSGFEAGLDGAAAPEGFQLGASLQLASFVGNLAASAALAGPYALPLASAARLEWRFSAPAERLVPRLGAGIEYRAAGFSPPVATAPTGSPPESLLASAQVGQALPGGRGNLGLFGSLEYRDGGLASWNASGSLYLPLPGSAILSINAGAEWKLEKGIEPLASVSLALMPPERRSLQYRLDLGERRDYFDLALPAADLGGLELGLRGEGLLGPAGGSRGARASGRYGVGPLETSGQLVYAEPEGGGASLSLELVAASALALAGGRAGLARRLGEAFVILAPDSTLAQERVELRPSQGETARSRAGEPALLAGLKAYEFFEAVIETPESPPDRRPKPERVSFLPAYRSGKVVAVGVAPVLAARGRLVGESGAPRTGLLGELFREGDPERLVGLTFTDESGRFECYDLEPGEYLVSWSDGSRSGFLAEAGIGGSIELGDLRALPGGIGGTP